MILFADGFFSELMENRTCYIGGWKGQGKSLLAMEIAEKFLKKGYYLATNMNTPWADDLNEIPLESKVFGIVDEGGIYTRSYETVSSFAEFSRKTKSIILFVGRREPHEALCDFSVYLFANLQKTLAIPIKIWRWYAVQKRKSYNGYLVQSGWEDFFGIYSSDDPGDYPINIMAFFEDKAKYLFNRFGRTYKVQDLAKGATKKGQDNSNDIARDLANVATKINDQLSVSPGKTRGRLRR